MSVSRDALAHHVFSRFRWVFCQLETLRRSVNRNLRRILEKLPKTLDETYERVLNDIDEENRAHTRRLLHCIAVAIRPLHVKELAEILLFDFDDIQGNIPKFHEDWRRNLKDPEEAVLSTCSSLITVVDSCAFGGRVSRVVQFSHFSVKEFLISDRLGSSDGDISRYHILPGPAHTILAQACLGFLLHLDVPTDWDIGKDFPLARYAAQHWDDHARFENVTSYVKDGMQSLFDPDQHHLEAWLGIYNIDDPYGDLPCPPNPLYYAAFLGFYGIVEHLVINHPRLINTVSGCDDFPVIVALSNKHIRIAEFLLQHGGKLNMRGNFGLTPLQMSIDADWFRAEDMAGAASFLLRHGADVNVRDSEFSTPLHKATLKTHVELVQLLLESGANVDARNRKGRTPLHVVLDITDKEQEHGDIIRLLLERGANVNARDNAGATPLLLAASRGNACITQILLEHGAHPNMKNNDGKTALHLAIECRSCEMAQILLENNAQPNVVNKDGQTPLHAVLLERPFYFGCDPEIFIASFVRLLLECGANVNAQDKYNTTPLLLAVKQKMYDIIRILLAHGAEPNVKNDGGKTPLHLLLELESNFSNDGNTPDLSRLLLDCGADVNAEDKNYTTPLLLAAELHIDDVARILLERGADPNVNNTQGKTPLHLLLERDFHDHDDINDVLVVEGLLLGRGADINAQDEDNITPLYLACCHRRFEFVQIILDPANAEKYLHPAQSGITLEGEYYSRNKSRCFTVFTRLHCICVRAEHGPHKPPTLVVLLQEARDGTGAARPW